MNSCSASCCVLESVSAALYTLPTAERNSFSLRLILACVQVRDELEQLLDDDDDMADLFLTRKMAGASSPLPSSAAPVWAPTSPTIASRASWVSKASGVTSLNHGAPTASDSDDVEELEMLLEVLLSSIICGKCFSDDLRFKF